MRFLRHRLRMGSMAVVVGLWCVTQCGCGSIEQNVALSVVSATVVGGQSPNNELQQIYYLGVFDPQEQVPPTVYRVRVHGQASFISATRFASGWVRADLIDSLGTSAEFNTKTGQLTIQKTGDDPLASLQTGRRFVLFGPEGFREAPKDHRLVIVMGASPEDFFAAIDESLGVISRVRDEQRNTALNQRLFQALVRLKDERGRLETLDKDINLEVAGRRGAGQ